MARCSSCASRGGAVGGALLWLLCPGASRDATACLPACCVQAVMVNVPWIRDSLSFAHFAVEHDASGRVVFCGPR